MNIGGGGGGGRGEVHIGGSPNFEMVDDKRTAINTEAVAALAAAGSNYAAMEGLAKMGGRIFNLANTVPAAVEADVKAAVNSLIGLVAAELQTDPNRSLSQTAIDVAGPPAAEGLKNVNALANGWIFTNVLTAESQAQVRDMHARQWGGAGPDK